MLKIKQIKTILLGLILAFALLSCRKAPIAGPLSLEYDHKSFTLSWSEVKGANYYILDINGLKVESDNNNYSFFKYNNGIYRVKIKAIFRNSESIYSNTITFEISDDIEISLYSDGEYLYWEEIEDAEYVIKYEDDLATKTISLTENKFEIPKSLKNKSSIVTLSVTLSDTLIAKLDIKLDFNKRRFYNSPYEIVVNGAKKVYINGEELKTGYHIQSDKLVLSPKFIENYQESFYLSISGNENLLVIGEIRMTLFELTSFYLQPFVGNDVKYEFQFNGFEIAEITGLTINEDFKVEGNMLIITKEFIEDFISDNPISTRIELNLVLKKGTFIKDWYLEIDLEA